ncbi:hypothetical protein NADFUDRAFT_84262 [Nadsonia fulvescens var. elongata DSM 6958]|uniref:Uncharacterized protein n=1 Tax=Nadsonia fulvescens var. elongata DSM 6958 TaxID=857566 RepID=A0A1E3PE95_9ASCO|nr:hypothetical protein NADFUDRAFT_84262 [Nadsonia fulvescens var. elongata DSM 6958]
MLPGLYQFVEFPSVKELTLGTFSETYQWGHQKMDNRAAIDPPRSLILSKYSPGVSSGDDLSGRVKSTATVANEPAFPV